jgi:hypothetical protein
MPEKHWRKSAWPGVKKTEKSVGDSGERVNPKYVS